MPRRDSGLRGYIGERIVEQWLKMKYPDCSIKSQIAAVTQDDREKSDNQGGKYLDFGVIKGNEVIGVYEVKTQDYIFDKSFKLNDQLEKIWENQNEITEFYVLEEKNGANKQSEKPRYIKSSFSFKCILILLAPPNLKGMKRLGGNLQNVKLFCEIMEEFGKKIKYGKIMKNIEEDLKAIKKLLYEPSKGKTFIDKFKEEREKVTKGRVP